MPTRAQIAHAAADALAAAAPSLPGRHALVGFDGFIDSIFRLVATRRSMRHDDYDALHTIPAFADRCREAAGKSTNIETVRLEDRFGGNGPLFAGALAALGLPVTYIGAIGRPEGPGVHPAFQPFADRCRRVVPLGPPSTTACYEFDDGKLMFNDTADVQRVTWDRVIQAVGLSSLRDLAQGSGLLGIVNWSLLGGVPGIWEGLRRDVFPFITPANAAHAGPDRVLFIDLSDPAKRTDTDVRDGLSQLADLEAAPGVSVTLGLNLAEAQRAARVLGLSVFPHGQHPTPEEITAAAAAIRSETNLDRVVIHPREGAAASDRTGDAAWFEGPLAPKPKLSTGAGDHFNGGFAFAQTLGLPLPQCLAVGTAVSGAYVRDAHSPSLDRLLTFLRDLPAPGDA